MSKAIIVAVIGLAAIVAHPLVLHGQTPAPTADAIAPKSASQPATGAPEQKGAPRASDDRMP
jgi:hypothetical protein